jgi:formylmethanofuran dehydrogenase subunit C|tara:strand:- start:232 stop:459 length:228 start_codon:yes stop_codon:yes gene_type:complete
LDVSDPVGLDREVADSQVGETLSGGDIGFAGKVNDQIGVEREKDFEIGLKATPYRNTAFKLGCLVVLGSPYQAIP